LPAAKDPRRLPPSPVIGFDVTKIYDKEKYV